MHDPLVDTEDRCLEAAVEPLSRGGGPGVGPDGTATVATLG